MLINNGLTHIIKGLNARLYKVSPPMNSIHFKRMKKAREAEENSPHPTHKVGALIHGQDHQGNDFGIARPN